MKHRAYVVFLICLFQVLVASTVNAQENWELKKVSKGVSVYTCERVDSDINAIRALFEVNATPTQYAATVLNVDEYNLWNFEAYNVRLLEQISDTELIYYTEALTPWPLMNRYVVLRLKVTQDSESKALNITLDNLPDMIPEQDGFIRIREYQAVLQVIPKTKDHLQVELKLKIDPGGSLPSWLTNMVTTRIPVNTYSNLKKRVESLPYPNHIFSSISN